ncbi:MAG: hypothetical protein J0L89_05950, partial [Xanthomonadales bacterium]|nr:hypothetical protein [Xanthomonadales bacterium]
DKSADAAVTQGQNIPDGTAADAAGGASSNTNRTDETVNYEISKTTKTSITNPGTVTRLSVAVAVDAAVAAATATAGRRSVGLIDTRQCGQCRWSSIPSRTAVKRRRSKSLSWFDEGGGATAELDPEPEPPHRDHATRPPAEAIAALQEDRSDRLVEGAPRFKRPRTTWRPPPQH